MQFGKYAIMQPVTYHFEQEPDWTWVFKPITTAEEMAITQFLTTERVMVLTNGARIGRPATNLEVAVREIALSFGGTNIKDNNKPLLEATASVDEIEAVLKQMPNAMVQEIYRALAGAIVGWGPDLSKLGTKDTASKN